MRWTPHGRGAGVDLKLGLLVGGFLALCLAGCGGGHRATTRTEATRTRSRASRSLAPRAAVVLVNRPASPSPAVAGLNGALGHLFKQAGPSSGASVYDLSAQRSLISLRAGIGRPPASVEKLYTTVAVLNKLGPAARLHTTVLGTGHLGPHGVWHGNLYLRGGGDPTFGDGTFNKTWEQGYGPTATQLAGQLKSKGIHSVGGQLIADESLFDNHRGGPATGNAPDVPDYEGQLSALTYDHGSTAGPLGPAPFAAHQLAGTLSAMGVHVKAAANTARTPHRARVLAVVSSPPMSVLLKLMDVPSDDLFADLFAKQLGAQFAGAGTLSAGARVMRQVIASYDLHPAIVDGSGLSRQDHSSPIEIVDLLREVYQTPTGDFLWDSLPTVGKVGTVQTIAVKTAADGHCVAKTGTLNNVTNLAGYCHVVGGHILAFALMIDGPSNSQALVLLGQMVAAVARY